MNDDLKLVRTRLKQGDYDGTDIMAAWLAIDALEAAQNRIAELEALVELGDEAIETSYVAGLREALEAVAKCYTPTVGCKAMLQAIQALIDAEEKGK